MANISTNIQPPQIPATNTAVAPSWTNRNAKTARSFQTTASEQTLLTTSRQQLNQTSKENNARGGMVSGSEEQVEPELAEEYAEECKTPAPIEAKEIQPMQNKHVEREAIQRDDEGATTTSSIPVTRRTAQGRNFRVPQRYYLRRDTTTGGRSQLFEPERSYFNPGTESQSLADTNRENRSTNDQNARQRSRPAANEQEENRFLLGARGDEAQRRRRKKADSNCDEQVNISGTRTNVTVVERNTSAEERTILSRP
ncbi:hypothetical protein BV898_19711 [Hypsibius exemplaris]|uniref:Uncharacterized protein n=1 Tax=Hypsibius exemplaris TaxID=2072580 RepID=A0A9X6RPP9_HYPEX|nr:hypothetical protein BV898_19711 [Hypsibius exemplaris]